MKKSLGCSTSHFKEQQFARKNAVLVVVPHETDSQFFKTNVKTLKGVRMKGTFGNWIKNHPERGCAMCGYQNPGLLARGLVLYKIVQDEKSGGNWLALCPNCAFAFDTVLKPAIYNAFKTHSISKVPDSWAHGEREKGDKEARRVPDD